VQTFFSVIIPTYNRLALVRAALESVFRQTFSDFEVIVIDDGSTDGTGEMLGEYAGRIRLLREANAGPAAARNLGLAEAKGRYVAFLDSDDLWFPWALETYHALLEVHGWPSGLQAQDVHFNNAEEPRDIAREPIAASLYTDYLASGREIRFFGCSWWVVKAEVLRKVGGFDARFANVEDFDLRLRCATAPGFLVLHRPVTVAYRMHDNNLVKVCSDTWAGLELLLEKERAGAYAGGEPRALERWRLISQLLRPNVLAAARAGQARRAWGWYGETIGWHVRLGRWRFLAAAPLLIACHSLFAGRQVDGAKARATS
jgi:glycosyltransferase involved in cell wall biosynthesis